jgi:hypothetical protein
MVFVGSDASQLTAFAFASFMYSSQKMLRPEP